MFLSPTLHSIFKVYTPHEGKCRFLRIWFGDVGRVILGVVSLTSFFYKVFFLFLPFKEITQHLNRKDLNYSVLQSWP